MKIITCLALAFVLSGCASPDEAAVQLYNRDGKEALRVSARDFSVADKTRVQYLTVRPFWRTLGETLVKLVDFAARSAITYELAKTKSDSKK